MRLLIIGTPQGALIEAGKIAHMKGAKVMHCDSVDAALNALRSGRGADLAMIDVKLDIAGFIQKLAQERFSLEVVACGIQSDTSAAVRAIKAGAKEFLPLPPDADLIAAVLQAVSAEDNTIIFRDPRMQQVISFADQIAPSDATVLITGESGTGKEVMARYVHSKSKRAHKPFVSINCAAIPENLLESELFGHEKGSFTGAISRRIGKFEEANGGTLLLDEISEMDLRLQAKLLRVIQERVVDRVGGNQPVKVDIRLLATSNRNLEETVKAGLFREDLYFRLNVVNVRLPALRERPADIDALAKYFAEKYAEANGVGKKTVAPATIEKLKQHHWKGNVRELENTLHRAVLLSPGDVIEPSAILFSGEDLVPDTSTVFAAVPTQPPAAAPDIADDENDDDFVPLFPASSGAHGAPTGLVGKTVAEVERDLIINTLNHCLGNRTHAANILGISIRTLRNKLKQYHDEGFSVPLTGNDMESASA